MPAITGTAGGRNGTAETQAKANFIRSLLLGESNINELRNYISEYHTPVNVSMVVNNACNLACRHCYLQMPTIAGRALGDSDWETVFSTALTAPTTLLSLNGKEVFLGEKGPRLLKSLSSIRKKIAPSKRIGVITNGTLIKPHRQIIEEAELTFLDISVDGIPSDHDAIRGTGAFSAMQPNLEWAVSNLGHRAFVSLTAQKRNLPRFNEAVCHFNNIGVQHIGVSFYHPAPYNDTSLSLCIEDYDYFFRNLHSLAAVELNRPLTVFVEIDTLSIQALTSFLLSEWFSLDRIEMDRSRVPWIDYAFTNGLRMQFKFFPIPWAGNHSVRITAEGDILSVDDIFDTGCYSSRALANIREHGCNFSDAMLASQNSPRVEEIIKNYSEAILPSIVKVVGKRCDFV